MRTPRTILEKVIDNAHELWIDEWCIVIFCTAHSMLQVNQQTAAEKI